ncbi:MAG: electron transfer flavoprotein beta subunit/FixA family protein [Propionibacteriaceae bacterium]|jgi:electron transfer flavoprotein beta subunit|nr:electron transfer flavoprotein beta subunit/FixA family protein [Propionibacteriaceae bacterium]
MTIAVAYKWAPEAQEASVDAAGRVDFSRAKDKISDYDAVAIQVGRRLADATGQALVGVTVSGPQAGQPVATKAALARGLDSVLVLAEEGLDRIGPSATASLLAGLVRQLDDVSLVLAGDSSTDVGARMTATLLAGRLGWACLTDVEQLDWSGSDWSITRTQTWGVETFKVTGPAVLALSPTAAAVKAPGMKDILAAGKKPVRPVALTDLGLERPDQGETRATARLTGPSRQGVVIDVSDPDAAAAVLVAALRQSGLLVEGSQE